MTYTTDDLAKAARTTIRTIRFWEIQGLFGDVPRTDRGDRIFDALHVKRAREIQVATMAGMSLKQISAAHPVKLVSEIVGAIEFMESVASEMDRDFDL